MVVFVLAIGKSLVGRMYNGNKPSGADLFVHGMQLLPDNLFVWNDPMQSTEVWCCAALYLQCLDMRIIAYNIVRNDIPYIANTIELTGE